MKNAYKSENENENENLRNKIIGLGENSLRKSYYPELKRNIEELENANQALQTEISERKVAQAKLEKLLNDLDSINNYLFEIENLNYAEIYSYLSSKLIELFGVKTVWIGVFDEVSSEMELRHTSMADEDNSQIVKLIGRQLISARTKIPPNHLEYIKSTNFICFNSISDLSFGMIPEVIGKSIQKIINIDKFVVVPLRRGEHLLGSVIAALSPEAAIPDEDLLTAFARIASIAISRKEAEESMLMSEELHKRLVATVPDLIIRTDLQANITFINDSNFPNFDPKNKQDYYGKSLFSFLSKKEIPRAIENTRKMFDTFMGVQEYTLEFENGDIVYCEINGDVIRDQDGNPQGIVYVIRDISSKKAAEQKLKDNELLLSSMIQNAPLGMYFYRLDENGDLRLSYANPAADDIIGINHSELFGKTIIEAFPNLENTEIPRKYKDAAEKGKIFDNVEIVYKDDRIEGAYELKAFQTTPNNMVTIFADISERKMAEQEIMNLNAELEDRVDNRTEELQKTLEMLNESNYELKLLNEQISGDSLNLNILNSELLKAQEKLELALAAKDKFFSIIAHDLRGPFTGFLSLTDLMAKDLDDMSVKDLRRISSSVNNAASTIYKLLEDLLEWSRSQMGTIPYNPCPVSFLQIAGNAELSMIEIAKSKNIEISKLLDADIYVSCDYNMITTVMRNLIGNGIKFSHTGKKIEIGICTENKELPKEYSEHHLFYVKDNGVGIPSNKLVEIFQIDKEYSTRGTNKEAGTGLGLVLCKDFIEKHNGLIWAESEFGIGSTFFFTLPKYESNAAQE